MLKLWATCGMSPSQIVFHCLDPSGSGYLLLCDQHPRPLAAESNNSQQKLVRNLGRPWLLQWCSPGLPGTWESPEWTHRPGAATRRNRCWAPVVPPSGWLCAFPGDSVPSETQVEVARPHTGSSVSPLPNSPTWSSWEF